MSRYLSFASVFLLFLMVSCQKEKSFEQGKASRGSLQGSFGDCLTKTINGTYTATKSLADTNYMEVEVDVTETGRYTIYTDTVNGYFFRATGTFSSVGSNTVRMKGVGTPGSAGTNDFIVFFDTTFCNVSVTVLPDAGSSGGTAVYTLAGSGGSCMNATPAGTFTQGAALTSANKITIDVNVTTAGTWNVTTSTVAGFSFSGSGTFTTTGNQTITLTASGTPNASGDQSFPVTVGTSSCSFTITVAAGTNPPPVNSNDYFPRTTNSSWTYITDGDTSIKVRRYVIAPTLSALGNVYNIFMEDEDGTIDSSGYYRRSGSDYYVYGEIGQSYGFDNPVRGEVIFLKDNVAANTTWTSGSFSGTAGGLPMQLRYKETILQKNVQVTVNGVNFSNTIVVKNQVEANISGTGWTDLTPAFGYILTYYSKGIGLVRTEQYDGMGVKAISSDLYSYQVF
jgi:hypothetical protein